MHLGKCVSHGPIARAAIHNLLYRVRKRTDKKYRVESGARTTCRDVHDSQTGRAVSSLSIFQITTCLGSIILTTRIYSPVRYLYKDIRKGSKQL